MIIRMAFMLWLAVLLLMSLAYVLSGQEAWRLRTMAALRWGLVGLLALSVMWLLVRL